MGLLIFLSKCPLIVIRSSTLSVSLMSKYRPIVPNGIAFAFMDTFFFLAKIININCCHIVHLLLFSPITSCLFVSLYLI